MACSRNEFDSSFPKGNAGAGLVPPRPGWPQPMYRLPMAPEAGSYSSLKRHLPLSIGCILRVLHGPWEWKSLLEDPAIHFKGV